MVFNIFLKVTRKYSISYKKISKNEFSASFQFYFMCIFSIKWNLVSKYEQLLILMDIDASILLAKPTMVGNRKMKLLGALVPEFWRWGRSLLSTFKFLKSSLILKISLLIHQFSNTLLVCARLHWKVSIKHYYFLQVFM
jgi:hypothetical protein